MLFQNLKFLVCTKNKGTLQQLANHFILFLSNLFLAILSLGFNKRVYPNRFTMGKCLHPIQLF